MPKRQAAAVAATAVRAFASSRGPSEKPPPPPPPPPPRPPRSRRRWVVAALFGTGAAFVWYFSFASGAPPTRRRALNQDTFVPFTVVAREPVSPTAVVLTLRLEGRPAAALEATRAAVARARRHGLWSVEVRQPQLQIARDYTPLPDVEAEESHGDGCTLRLFVRAVPGGEMSRYLLQRAVGDAVDLRGPRLGFNVRKRLGGGGGGQGDVASTGGDAAGTDRHVVVVAGGTGIAPALQTVDAVLGGGDDKDSKTRTAVTILWASRQHYDCEGCDPAAAASAEPANPVARDLCALQRRHGRNRLRVRCFVDEQQTFVTEAAVRASLGLEGGRRMSWWQPWWWWNRATPADAAASPTTTSSCIYHSAHLLANLEADPAAGSEADACTCTTPAAAGKNLLIVSGPDGFVKAFAGAKTWTAGQERQGPVGGVAGALRRRYPDAWKDWLVLKL